MWSIYQNIGFMIVFELGWLSLIILYAILLYALFYIKLAANTRAYIYKKYQLNLRYIQLYNQRIMDLHHKKLQYTNRWRDFGQCFYDYMYQNYLQWPVTSLQWGNILTSDQQQVTQRLYFSCRTDGIYNPGNQTWQNTPNYIIVSSVQLPTQDHYSINQLKSLFNHDAAKKHPNMKIKTIITHPGQVIVIRASPTNRKVLASKTDTNEVYIWTSQKYKISSNALYANTPDLTLSVNKSQRPNYAMKFAPSLMRLITASGSKIQLFDLDGGGAPTKRQLGSVMGSNSIKPVAVLEDHDGVQDLAFKNNQVWISGGQDKQIAIWDYRMKINTQRLKGIHNHDINCLSVKDNIILSGGQQGRVNIIDDRMFRILYQKQTERPVRSIGFNPNTRMFAVGNDILSIYSLDDIEKTGSFEPKFVHHGMKNNINEFDWNQDMPMSLATTCQQLDLDNPSHGGLIHFFKPSDLLFDTEQAAIDRIRRAYMDMSGEQRKKIDKFIQ